MLRGKVFTQLPDAFVMGLKGGILDGVGKTVRVSRVASSLTPSFSVCVQLSRNTRALSYRSWQRSLVPRLINLLNLSYLPLERWRMCQRTCSWTDHSQWIHETYHCGKVSESCCCYDPPFDRLPCSVGVHCRIGSGQEHPNESIRRIPSQSICGRHR